MKYMMYEENFYLPETHPGAKNQRKRAEKFIKAVTKYFKLAEPPPYTFLGLNPSELVEKLENSKEGKTPKEIKEINKEIQRTQATASNNDKIIFDFDDIITRVVITSRTVPISGGLFGLAFYDCWTALFDLSLSDQFIFGRVCKKPKHGSGTYCFAPLDMPISQLQDIIEEKSQEAGMEKTLLNIIQMDSLIKLIDNIRYTKEAADQLRPMREIIKNKELTGIATIDQLNGNNPLMKIMKKVGHFGAVQQGLSKLRSELDISTVYIPLKQASLFHLVNFESYDHKNSLNALFSLATALHNL